jgi:hypothetical protein
MFRQLSQFELIIIFLPINKLFSATGTSRILQMLQRTLMPWTSQLLVRSQLGLVTAGLDDAYDGISILGS